MSTSRASRVLPLLLAFLLGASILATLPAGDSLSFSRLQRLLDLTPGNLITHLRKLDEAGYVANVKSRGDSGSHTSVHLTNEGRAAFDRLP